MVQGHSHGQRVLASEVLQEGPVLELLRRPPPGDRGQPDGGSLARSGSQRAAAAMGPLAWSWGRRDRGRATMTVAARASARPGALLYLLSFLPTYVQWELQEICRRGIPVEVILSAPWPRSVLWDEITELHGRPPEGLRVRALTFHAWLSAPMRSLASEARPLLARVLARHPESRGQLARSR